MKNTHSISTFACCLAALVTPLKAQSFQAFTEPTRTIEVSAADTGRIASVHVKRGDDVRQEDLLVTLDSQVLQASRRVAEKMASSSARLEALEVELELKTNRYQQLRDLLDEGAGSPQEVRRAKADVDVARLNVEAARDDQQLAVLKLAEIEARVEQRRVRSSVDGIVTDVLKEPGEYVSANDPHVATIVQLDTLRATFYLPTAKAITLAVGDVVPLQFPDSGRLANGTIEYVSPVTAADSGRVRADVLIDNSKRQLRSGIRCILDVTSAAGPRPAQ